MASKIGKGEWVALYVATGAIDVVQWLADFTGIGIVVSAEADPFIGVALAGYLQWRGVSMFSHISRLLSIVGGTIAEEMTGSVAPAWIIDVLYIHRDVRKEEAAMRTEREQEEFLQSNIQRPLYQEDEQGNVSRAPNRIQASDNVQAMNFDGIRAPGGGLNR